ncbi:MAG TPA: guanylate kinase [Clostridia bacterium]|nr:guanylate kinase [Clostridia bacterium]
MGKIFCLMGKSGSGKDTVFRRLLKERGLGLKAVVTYTTRPRRQNERDGVEYYFITCDELNQFRDQGRIIEIRRYDTVQGAWYYCTVDDGQIDLDSGNYLMIVTLEAFNSLKRYFGAEKVVPLYLFVDDGERLTRAIAREKRQPGPDYSELCRRFLADAADFEDQKLAAAGIHQSYANDNLDDCADKICRAIAEDIAH